MITQAIAEAAPGVPALVLLSLVTIFGLGIGFSVSPPSRGIASSFGCVAVVAAVAAAPFWFWAAYKVITRHDHDLGIYTFALVLAASAFTLKTARRIGPATPLPAKAALSRRLLLSATYAAAAAAAVFLNYAFVLMARPDLPATFRVYLVVAAAWWSVLGGVWLGMHQRHQEYLGAIYRYEVAGDESDSEIAASPTTRMLGRPPEA
jgi:hypothetical protein